MSNYKTLFLLRILKSTIEIFLNSFFVMYFLKVSNQNVLKLGIYYILVYFFVYTVIYGLRNLCKSNHRVQLLRIGILLNFIYFLLILLLKEKIVDYIYLMAFIYGLEEGFYYSVYNNFESIGIENHDRAKFSGIYTSCKSFISIIIPIIFGTVITAAGFKECTLIIIFLVILQICLSFIFKDIPQNNDKKTDFKKYKKIVNQNEIIKKIHSISFLNGFIYTGAFSSVVTLYIIKVLNTSINLGIFSSVFAIINCILGYFFAKKLPKNKYPITVYFTCFLTIIGLILLMCKVNFFTVTIFNFLQLFSSTLTVLIIDNYEIDISNYKKIKSDFKVEYFVYMEKNIFWGRFLGYILYIILGINQSIIINDIILILFGIIIIILSINIVDLMKTLGKEKDFI